MGAIEVEVNRHETLWALNMLLLVILVENHFCVPYEPSYLNNLDPFNFDIPEGSLAWDAVIGWRIATYYVPILVTWLLLVKLALSKISKQSQE